MDLVDTLQKISPMGALFIVCNVLGFVLKKADRFNDKYIPLVLFLFGGVVNPFIANTAIVPWDVAYPVVYHALIGLGIGGAAVGGNQVLRQLLGYYNEPQPQKPPPPPEPPKPLPTPGIH